jgi:putative hydrolase of HD superfamily
MNFLNELEKLKGIYRRNKVLDRSRGESSAEHSWHIAVMAFVLAEHVDTDEINLWKVVKMLLLHDIVEVYAGDTWAYDISGNLSQQEREDRAAAKLFSLLPDDQAVEFEALRKEFDEGATPEAAFAASIDALQPLSNHLLSGKKGDDEPAPSRNDVLRRKSHIEKTSRSLWELAQGLIHDSVQHGLYE